MRLLDLFCGEGGSALGYSRAGFEVFGVDNSPARLKRYPFEFKVDDALEYLEKHGASFDAIHASPPCQGYSIATSALPDRLARYDRMIATTREVLNYIGKPYIIENVYNARREMLNPQLLCGRMFGLSAVDDDGTPLVMDRHRVFETNWGYVAPTHVKHDKALQVAGSYDGARRDKNEARHVRKGGYVPSVDLQRQLLGLPHASEKGCWLSIPPIYSETIGKALMIELTH